MITVPSADQMPPVTGAPGRLAKLFKRGRSFTHVEFGMVMLVFLLLYGLYRGVAALLGKLRSATPGETLPPANIPSWHPEHLR